MLKKEHWKIIAYSGEIPKKPVQSEAASNHLKIIARNFEYNETEYVVKAGEEVTISFSSVDGYHGLSIDEFDVKIQSKGKQRLFQTSLVNMKFIVMYTVDMVMNT